MLLKLTGTATLNPDISYIYISHIYIYYIYIHISSHISV